MESPITLRLSKETRDRVARLASQRKLTSSEVIREAIDAWVEHHESARTPFETAKDLIGCVKGGDPGRSKQSLTDILKRRRNKS